ncbi:transglutaminase-like cysteine peptidase [Photobacterium damselae]|uniref:transglutaminase-like cysteine peptidase n=1 Tax=Photobacterium damselae TaxID=38293 RepID=UPI00406873D0
MGFNFKKAFIVSSVLASSCVCQASTFAVNMPQFISKYGNKAELRFNHVNGIIKNYSNSSTIEKLKQVNTYFNQFAYSSDINLWSRVDYWATTLEFIGAGSGDCEDFALAKYQTLRKMGVSDKKLKLEYVEVIYNREAHIVLNYYKTPSSTPLVLDNYNKQILPSTQRTDLYPFFVFNTHSFKILKGSTISYSNTSSIRREWNSYKVRTTLRKPNYNIFEM